MAHFFLFKLKSTAPVNVQPSPKSILKGGLKRQQQEKQQQAEEEARKKKSRLSFNQMLSAHKRKLVEAEGKIRLFYFNIIYFVLHSVTYIYLRLILYYFFPKRTSP